LVVIRNGTPSGPRKTEEFVFTPGVEEFTARLRKLGYLLVVVTNQPDIGRGLLSPEVLGKIHGMMKSRLAVDDILFCPHDGTTACSCRKPAPGMLLDAARRHRIDLERSWMIGDRDKDVEAGRRAGCRTIILTAPYNLEVEADFRAGDFGECLHIIEEKDGSR